MSNDQKFPWKRLLAKYFRTVKSIDSEIEVLRQELCAKSSFIPRVLFNTLDNNKKTFLSLNDFKVFLKAKFIQFTEESLRRFIHNFDKDGDFSIDYNEYLSIILPRENELLKGKTEKRKAEMNNNDNELRDNEIDYSIELVFIKIIQMELNLIHQLASIAEELRHSKDFTTYEAFLVIANEDKYITEINLGRFLQEKNIELEGNELLTLLFRVDSDADGRISYEEFLEIFFPLQNCSSSSSSSLPMKSNENKGEDMDTAMDKELLTRSVNRENRMRYKHGLSRYDNKTDNIMLNTTKDNTYKGIEIDYKSQRHNPYKRQSSLKNENDDYYSKKNEKSVERNNDTPLKENGLLSKFISPPRERKKEKEKERLHQTNQSEYNYETPLSIGRNSSQKKIEENSLTFDRNKARYNIRTAPKSIPKLKQNGSNNDPMHTCCSCRPCCKNEKTKRENLLNLLKDFVMNDSKVEEIKNKIASDKNIAMLALFEYFDEAHRDNISKKDLQSKLKNIGLIVSLSDINIIFELFDRDNDGLLNYEEFSDLILPKKYEEAKLLNSRRLSSSTSFTFNNMKANAMKLLSDLFSAIIEAEKANEANKKSLLSLCTVDDSFNLLKKRYSSVIYQEDLTEFLEDNGLSLQQDEADLLIERLDKNQDGIVSLDEYTNAISPKVK